MNPEPEPPGPAPERPGRRRAFSLEWGLSALALGLIAVGCLMVLRPFVSSILWAGILALAAWPLHLRLRDRLRGRRALAAVITVLLLATVLLVPVGFLAANLAGGVGEAVQWVRHAAAHPASDPPGWLSGLPLIGGRIAARWGDWTSRMDEVYARAGALLVEQSGWILRQGLALSRGLFDLGMSILFVFFLLIHGERAGLAAVDAADRLGGERGRRLLTTAVRTIHATLLGSLGTALAQATLGYVGYLIVGAPSPLLLATATFFLSLVPVGAPVIWIPLALWLFTSGSPGKALFMVLWGALAVGSVDNILRPWLTQRTARLPFLLVLCGVIGGAAAFGVIGLFLGPALLAVGFSMAREWIRSRPELSGSPAADTANGKDPS